MQRISRVRGPLALAIVLIICVALGGAFAWAEGDTNPGGVNQLQVDVYEGAPWKHQVPDDRVCVLHTLVISPAARGKGYGRMFIRFYEDYALQHGCTELRIDTNERNLAARAMYSKYDYQEIDIVPTTFNGIAGVNLVLLEKQIRDN